MKSSLSARVAPPFRATNPLFVVLVSSVSWALAACSDDAGSPGQPEVATKTQPLDLASGEALDAPYAFFADAYQIVVGAKGGLLMGAGEHPALTTETSSLGRLVPSAHDPDGGTFTSATATVLIGNNGAVSGTLAGLPDNETEEYELWFVKNIPGQGKSVLPEPGDLFVKAGRFDGPNVNHTRALSTTDDCASSPGIDAASLPLFDLDLVVVTKKCQHPTQSRVLVGSRTIFEKRFFRERICSETNGAVCPPLFGDVSGPELESVATTDPLVRRGAQLFFEETFDGNGRTCGTCHRQERNLTIDADFIATLPSNDPLFVFETEANLSQLELGDAVRGNGLILENVDGFAAPTEKFVLRSVNHTFAMTTTMSFLDGLFGGDFPFSPPQQRVGWGGDGAPGRGTLHEFALGAIVQHAPRSMNRIPGDDFRLPTQEELDALEAFQLFTGRSDVPSMAEIEFREASAQRGKQLADVSGAGQCGLCHSDVNNNAGLVLGNFATGVGARSPQLPLDDGLRNAPLVASPTPNSEACLALVDTHGVQAVASFSTPPLIEAADTLPLFHDNSAATIEDAIRHYTSDDFLNSCGAIENNLRGENAIVLSPAEVDDLGSFLRHINVGENLRQIRQRVTFVRDHRGSGNTKILELAIIDTADALRVLEDRNLNPSARHSLATIKLSLEIARANPDDNRPAFMSNVLYWIESARDAVFVPGRSGMF